jgi:hypothetical protein
MWKWWKRYLYGVGAGDHDSAEIERFSHIAADWLDHLERCPFCGQTFDIRDVGQVLLHRNHLFAASGSPAVDPFPEEYKAPSLGNVVPLRPRRKA